MIKEIWDKICGIGRWFKKQRDEIKEDGLKSYFKKRLKKILVVLGVGVLLAQVIPTPIPQHLKLKAIPERILNSRVILQEQCVKWSDNGTSTCEKTAYESVIKYRYASDVEMPKAKGEDLSKRTKNALFFKGKLENEKQEWTGVFYTGEPFYQDTNRIWYQTKSATTTPNAFEKQMGFNSFFGQKVLALSTTTYAGAGDGRTAKQWVSWATARDVAASAFAYTDTALFIGDDKYSGNYGIARGFFPTDTSGLPDNADISAVLFKAYFYGQDGNWDPPTEIHIVEGLQESTSYVEADDHYLSRIGSTSFGSVSHSTWAVQYHTWTLDSNGRANISKTGWSKFALRSDRDLDDGPLPTSFNRKFFYSSERTGTSEDPYFEITYTVPAVRRIIMK